MEYVPLYGSILLTVIFVWIIGSTIIGNRRKITDALAGRPAENPIDVLIRAGVLDEDDIHVQAWRDYCDEPVGPEPDPIPFAGGGLVRSPMTGRFVGELSGEYFIPISRRPSSPPNVASGPADEGQLVSRPEVTSEITPYPADCTCHPDDRPPICLRRFAASECVAAYRARYPEIADMWADEGEPLAVPPPPNIGGEGHPDYQGPHYATAHDRFVPYDVLRDPPEGAAVHIVGNAACVGPLEIEPGATDDTLDPSREVED
jgi:hypothetical protein